MKKILFSLTAILGLAVVSIGQTTFNFTGSIQTYTVPPGISNIQIEAYGAQGGSTATLNGGLGASMQGEFAVSPGQVFDILVGEWPGTANNGGGGGTFVVENGTNIPYIIAGAGGGASGNCCGAHVDGMPGVAASGGTQGFIPGCTPGAGGIGGNGGGGGDPASLGAGGGGGMNTNGGDGEIALGGQ